jgi:hypothetical protein
MMPDDATTLTRFDDFLDALVARGGADDDGLEPGLIAATRRVHALTFAPAPDRAFARDLRRSLLTEPTATPRGMRSSDALRATLTPPARIWTPGRWWPRAELAAMALIVGLLVVLLASGGGRWWPRGSENGGYLAAPSVVTGSTPAPLSAVAMLFLVDVSGSMSYDPRGGTPKLEMEKETLRRAVAALPEGTTIGVIAFNDHQQWAVPLTELGAPGQADRDEIVAAIDGITAEGGSELPAALTVAFAALRTDVTAPVKHVVLLSDGKSRGGDEQVYSELLAAAAADGITLSTIAFGEDADTATMQLLAELGNGRYHLVVTPADIPMLTLREGQPSIDEGPATPVA